MTKLDTRSTRILRLTLAAAMMAPAIAVSAQTVRISAGVSSDGRKCYREVFEYDYVSKKPTFPGGDTELVAFVNSHRRYPEEAYRRGIEGRVVCSFVVNADGAVSHIKVIKGVEPTLNEEAIRVLAQMPDWTPGRLDGRPVPVRVIWPVPFRR